MGLEDLYDWTSICQYHIFPPLVTLWVCRVRERGVGAARFVYFISLWRRSIAEEDKLLRIASSLTWVGINL